MAATVLTIDTTPSTFDHLKGLLAEHGIQAMAPDRLGGTTEAYRLAEAGATWWHAYLLPTFGEVRLARLVPAGEDVDVRGLTTTTADEVLLTGLRYSTDPYCSNVFGEPMAVPPVPDLVAEILGVIGVPS